ncbi:MAG: hypothetical protein K2Q10_11505 [Rhodospirillales bacterium]|nr:hypothetical protein [Rhodospirillales bacterium]
MAIGTLKALRLSARLGLAPLAEAERLERHFAALGLPVRPARDRVWDARVLLSHMASDKKVADGKVTFVVARGIGQAFLSDSIPPAEVLAVLEDSIAA